MATPSSEPLSRSTERMSQLFNSRGKFKERSFLTSKDVHIPQLLSESKTPSVVLLGDSMIERMQTTGGSLSFEPWPSETMLSEPALDTLNKSSGSKMARVDDVFNAGVGGDRYDNIIYRLVGDSSKDRNLPGLAAVLVERDIDIQVWVVHAGTNDLHRRRGLSDTSVDLLRRILLALISISQPATHILLTGLFYRKDISNELIDKANMKLESIAASVNSSLNADTISFLPTPTSVDKNIHMDDHVHLNQDGYRIWAKSLIEGISHALEHIKTH